MVSVVEVGGDRNPDDMCVGLLSESVVGNVGEDDGHLRLHVR